jgi:hypothetical protein
MNIYTNAQYYFISGTTVNGGINVEINGTASCVPLDPSNTDYINIMALVQEGKLTIAPAS